MLLMQSQKPKKQRLEESRQLRREYRSLTFDVEAEAEYLASSSTQNILSRFQQGESLFAKVSTTEEAVLDSQFIRKTMEIAVQKAQSLKLGMGFDLHEFIQKVSQRIKVGDDHEWSNLTADTHKACSLPPRMVFLNGALENEAKVKVARKSGPTLVKDKNIVKPQDVLWIN